MHGAIVGKMMDDHRLVAFGEWKCAERCNLNATTCEKCNRVVNIVRSSFRRHKNKSESLQIPLRIINLGEVHMTKLEK